MKMIHSKEETLAFLSYLQSKEEILIEKEYYGSRTMFNAYLRNLFSEAQALEDMIRKAPNPAEAYRKVAHNYAKQNSLWSVQPELGYIFLEDLADLVEEDEDKTHLFSKNKQQKLLELLTSDTGMLRKPWETVLPEKYHHWIKNGVTLASREVIFRNFPTEYMRFRQYFYGEKGEQFEVLKTELTDNAYSPMARHWKNLLNEDAFQEFVGPDHLFIGYNSRNTSMDEEKLASAAKLVCMEMGVEQIRIVDYHSNTMILVQKVD